MRPQSLVTSPYTSIYYYQIRDDAVSSLTNNFEKLEFELQAQFAMQKIQGLGTKDRGKQTAKDPKSGKCGPECASASSLP